MWNNLGEKNALSLHIGVDPRKSISIVHYTELIAGAPYRFTKVFNQRLVRNGKKVKEEFFHFCVKNEKKLVRDENVKIYKNFVKKFKPKSVNFGRGKIILFPLKKFYEINLDYLTRNPYAWTKKNFK